MNLYIVRHSETDWNRERKVQGRVDIPLNEAGVQLAKATREALKEIPFDLVYTSPLKRARQTAELIAGSFPGEIRSDERLIEMNFGEYEGWSVLGEETPEKANFLKFFKNPEAFVPAPEGESFENLIERMGAFIQELFTDDKLEDKNILIVSHGAAINALLTYIKNNPLEKLWGDSVGKNCSVTKITVNQGSPKIIYEKRALGKVM